MEKDEIIDVTEPVKTEPESFAKKYLKPTYVTLFIIVGLIVGFLLIIVILVLVYMIFARKPQEDLPPPTSSKKTKRQKPKPKAPDSKAVFEQEKKRANDIQEEISITLINDYKDQRILPNIVAQSDTESEMEPEVEDETRDPIEILDD